MCVLVECGEGAGENSKLGMVVGIIVDRSSSSWNIRSMVWKSLVCNVFLGNTPSLSFARKKRCRKYHREQTEQEGTGGYVYISIPRSDR